MVGSWLEVDIFTVFGSGSDPDGDALTFEWTQVSGPKIELSGATTESVRFAAPSVAVSELVVRDATQASAPALVDVVVKNPSPVVVDPKPKGCGCTSGFELLPLSVLSLLLRVRRRR